MARVLIAGLGSIGRRHLRNLLHLGVGDILLYRTTSSSVSEAPHLPVYTDLKRALAEKPDVVLVANPTAHHVRTARMAAEAGCHLFLEKPVSHDFRGVEELKQVVQEKNLTSLVGFDLRFDPGLRKAKELLEEGVIGRVTAIHAQVGQYLPDWHPHEDYRKGVSARRETGGGVILDLIHELDYVAWLGGPVAEVGCFAETVSQLEIETEDTATIMLKFTSGALGSVNLDYIQRKPSRTCRIIGEEGTILWDYFENTVSWFKAGKEHWEELAYPHFERNDRFLLEMQHLLACLEGKDRPQVTLEAGIDVLRTALAAKESARKGIICPIVR